jgi:hypothetical protein
MQKTIKDWFGMCADEGLNQGTRMEGEKIATGFYK